MKAGILTIGDELLHGTTIDTNSAWIGQQTSLIGLTIHKIVSVRDTMSAIQNGLASFDDDINLLFTTGGLGPTHDDITKQAVASYFSLPLANNSEATKHIRQIFKGNEELIALNDKLSLMPVGADVIPNDRGTAMGIRIHVNKKIVIMMPGVPHEMKQMMQEHILPYIQNTYSLPYVQHHYIMTAGIGESSISKKIKPIENALPEYIRLAYLPSLAEVKLRLTVQQNPADYDENEIKDISSQIRQKLKKYVYAYRDESLEKVVGQLFSKNHLQLATAESCTGGYIAHRITRIAGSSNYFKGTIVSYSNEIKKRLLGVDDKTLTNYGAVSKETVVEMVYGVVDAMHVDVGIAVSGIAGPGGGSKEKPVGTVWLAIADKNRRLFTRKFQLGKDRLINIKIVSTLALNLLRRFVLGELTYD